MIVGFEEVPQSGLLLYTEGVKSRKPDGEKTARSKRPPVGRKWV